jgi:hypothetical protein
MAACCSGVALLMLLRSLQLPLLLPLLLLLLFE